jgi:phosphohistidine phosphatase
MLNNGLTDILKEDVIVIGKLIFIRHGEAAIGIEDDDRNLNSNGYRQINKILPSLKKNIDQNLKLTIACSPILRSIQTAEIIADYLGIYKIDKFNWISSGNIDDLQKELSDKNIPYCMIVVGHEPHLSNWGYQISGYRLPFDKASTVCFEITSNDPLKAVPVWFTQPYNEGSLNELNINNNPIIRELQNIVSFQLQEIFCAQKQFWQFPDDPESIHTLLAKTQALQSLITFIKPLMEDSEYVEVQKQLKEFIQNFMHIQKFDLLNKELKHLASIHPESINILSVFLQRHQAEREEEKNKIYPEVFEKMTYLLFKLLIWSKTGDLEENNLPNISTFKDLRRNVLSAI